MRIITLLWFSLTLYGTDLICISVDSTPEALEVLSVKYKQTLFLDNNGVYLIPSECKLERYFGGASQDDLHLVLLPPQAETITTTQEVFEAKNTAVIEEKIKREKSVLLVEGKGLKDFLEDEEGRLFGGSSETALDLFSQQNEFTVMAKMVSRQQNSIQENLKMARHPSCQLLDNGAGYKLNFTINPRLYVNGRSTPITDNTVLFK